MSNDPRRIARRLVEARDSIVSLGGRGGLKDMRDSMTKRASGIIKMGSAQVFPMSPERYMAIRLAFNRCDVNGSGDISHKEMRSAIKSLGGVSAACDAARQLIAEADDDGDGRISFPEFRQIACQAACTDLAAQLTLSSSDEADVLECLMGRTEAVIAAEHVLLYKYRLGELQLMASRTQETRVSTRPKLQVGEILDPVAYEKCLRTGKALVLAASRSDVTHIGGTVASVLVVPIYMPGGRALGILEFVNKTEAFDQAEQDAAVQLAAHLTRALVQKSPPCTCILRRAGLSPRAEVALVHRYAP